MFSLLKNNLLLSIVCLLVTTSCSNYIDKANENPNEFTSAPGDLLIGQANLALVKMISSQNARITGIWVDHFTGVGRCCIPPVWNDIYYVLPSNFNDDWNDIYMEGLVSAKLAQDIAVTNGYVLMEGVSKIVQGLMLGELAALWGDIPWSQALDYMNFPNPVYDSQTSVLAVAQSLLSEGIDKVGDASISEVYGPPVFISNEASWAEVGHSLKASIILLPRIMLML